MSQVNLFRTQKGLEKDFTDFLDARYSTIASSTGQGVRVTFDLPKKEPRTLHVPS